MKPVAVKVLAPPSEPSPLDARTHAIKNCVSVILGLACIVERDVDPAARPRVTQLVTASRRLMELVKHPASPFDVVRDDVSIPAVLKLVVDRLAPQAESRGVHLEVDCAGGTLRGDFANLVEALFNLGSNALYFSLPGRAVRITTRRSRAGDHEWSVEDTGCGIPTGLMPRLGTIGVTTRDQGTGLGLSLALQVITQHQGVMRIESVEGRGTKVTILLPGSATSKA